MATDIMQAQIGGPSVTKMPGHWVLARLGKRVLRPGGVKLTHQMLDGLGITSSDVAVEFAPGLGQTARRVIPKCSRYIGVDRDMNVVRALSESFRTDRHASFVHASADKTGLEAGVATVVWGEAMLSIQGASQKERIIREAARLLAPGGRYGIHELCFTPDSIDASTRRLIERELSLEIHVGVQPATEAEWRALLERNGFRVTRAFRSPMRLLEPARLLRDEGLRGAMHILYNALRDPQARRRALAMRRLFRKFQQYLCAISLIAVRE
jgi:Methyltransferase domain.